MKKLLALSLAALFAAGVLASAASAKKDASLVPGVRIEGIEKTEDRPTGGRHVVPLASTALTDAYLEAKAAGKNNSSLPARYDGRELGYIPTHAQDQSIYGMCWAMASLLAIECYMIKNGVTDAATGLPAATDIDLSEYHLTWFTYDKAYDKLGMLRGDSTNLYNPTPNAPAYAKMMVGGFAQQACFTLMRREGPVSESASALTMDNYSTGGPDPKYAWAYNSASLRDFTMVSARNDEQVKKMIMECGAGVISVFFDKQYLNESTSAFYNPNADTLNHDVAVVGWDDDYPAENFGPDNVPLKNGAWICRNSWGESWGDGGFFYVSYEDPGPYMDNVYFFEMEPTDNYDNVYQYDGTAFLLEINKANVVANTFTSFGDELLEAVAFDSRDEDLHFTIYVYTDVKDPKNPETGELKSTKAGTIPYAGYHTVRLDDPVLLSPGQRYSVVVDYELDSGIPTIPIDVSMPDGLSVCHHVSGLYQSAYISDHGWKTAEDTNFRIKAYTNDPSPNEESVTIGFFAAGEQVGTYTAASGSLFTLPDEAAAPDGYRLAGWAKNRCVDAVNEVDFYLPGETVLADEAAGTLFALFRRDFDGDTVFRLVEDECERGKYVLTTSKSGDGYTLSGLVLETGTKRELSECVVPVADTGSVIDGDVLTGADPEQVVSIVPAYDAWAINKPGSELSISADSDGLFLNNTPHNKYSVWYIAPGEDGVSVVANRSGWEKNFIGLDADGKFAAAEEPNLYLWRQEDIYRTEPIPSLPHTPGDINEDGPVDARDLVRMMKLLSGDPITVNPEALDTNGDGSFTAKDLLRLLKRLSGSDVEIF